MSYSSFIGNDNRLVIIIILKAVTHRCSIIKLLWKNSLNSAFLWWPSCMPELYFFKKLQNNFLRPPLRSGKSVHIRSFSGPYFRAFGLNTENTDRKNSKYGHFLRSALLWFESNWLFIEQSKAQQLKLTLDSDKPFFKYSSVFVSCHAFIVTFVCNMVYIWYFHCVCVYLPNTCRRT